jgi:predicted nuclease of predicted toxin-antitoxin system
LVCPARARREIQARWESRTSELIGESGHDVQTAVQEKLGGIDDARLFEACALEGRCLITLDLDFADVLRADGSHPFPQMDVWSRCRKTHPSSAGEGVFFLGKSL